MKPIIYYRALLGLLIYMLCRHSFSQSTTITPGGASLDNNNTQKSLNLPRLSYEQIKAISLPQEGAMIYDISSKCIRYYNGSEWICLADSKSLPNTSSGYITDVFTVKYYNWRINKNYDIYSTDLISDTDNNLYLAGSSTIGPCGGSIDGNYNGKPTAYVVKYNPSNQLQWCFSVPGKTIWSPPPMTYSDFFSYISSIKYSNGAVYVLGYFNQSITVNGVDISTGGGIDIFVAKLNALNGSIIWFKKITNGTGNETAKTLLVDDEQNIYVSGNYDSNFTLDGSRSITNNGGTDAFIAKFNSSGNLLAHASFGSTGDDKIDDIEWVSGGVTAVGTFVNTIDIKGTALNGLSGSNMFWATFNNLLDTQYAFSINTTGTITISDIQAINYSLFWVAGRISGSAQFGTATYENTGFLINLATYSNTPQQVYKYGRGQITRLSYLDGNTFGLLNFSGNSSLDDIPIGGTSKTSDVALFKFYNKHTSPFSPRFKWYKVYGDKDAEYTYLDSNNNISNTLIIKSAKEVLFPVKTYVNVSIDYAVGLYLKKYIE